jgi:hypothetical protein
VPCARLTEPTSAPPEPEALRWSGQNPGPGRGGLDRTGTADLTGIAVLKGEGILGEPRS